MSFNSTYVALFGAIGLLGTIQSPLDPCTCLGLLTSATCSLRDTWLLYRVQTGTIYIYMYVCMYVCKACRSGLYAD